MSINIGNIVIVVSYDRDAALVGQLINRKGRGEV